MQNVWCVHLAKLKLPASESPSLFGSGIQMATWETRGCEGASRFMFGSLVWVSGPAHSATICWLPWLSEGHCLAHSSSFSSSKTWPHASVTPWQRDQLLQQGHPVPRLELLRAKAGSPCEVQLSRWVPVCPGSWPHSYFLPNYHCHWHRGTSGSTQDAEKAAWHIHGCTQSKPFTECFIPRHSQSSTPLVHSWLIRTIHLWKTLGLFNAITRDSYMFIPMMLTDRGIKRLAIWLYSPLASSVKWGACSTLGF